MLTGKSRTDQGEPWVDLDEISREMVAAYRELFGRTPQEVRTAWAGSDTVVVVLEETLSPAERNLVRVGEHQRLRDARTFLQYVCVRELCEPIERITGRKVRAYISGMDTEVDGLSLETFVLHPAGYDGPSRVEARTLRMTEAESPGAAG